MSGTVIDFAEFFFAAVLLAALLLLPGAAIANFAGSLDEKEPERAWAWGTALLYALAILPALLSLTARLASLDAAVAVQVVLALLGIGAARKIGWPARSVVCGLLACTAVVALEMSDFQWSGKLYHATLALDMVKHAATVNSIVSWGLPLVDPFVSRSEPAGYYYYFYTLAAVPVRLTMGAIDARAVVGALSVFDGAGLLALAFLIWRKSMPNLPATKNVVWLLVVLLLCGNLDVVANLVIGLAAHAWPIELEWWNEQVAPWTLSLLWVPHHVLALIAGMFGLLLISERPETRPTIAAGIAFASCVGASVWVGLCTALAALFWLASLVVRRQRERALALLAAGVLAGILLAPQIFDLLRNRTIDGSPVELSVRLFMAVDVLVPPGLTREALYLVLLPLNYFIGWGILAVGVLVFWRSDRLWSNTETARMLTCAAAAGLLAATFMRSTILKNDLGWRAMLLTQLALLVWTAAVITIRSGNFRIGGIREWPVVIGVLLIIGYAGTLYQLGSIRAYPFLEPHVLFVPHIAHDPVIDNEQAAAYRWANAHVPLDAVLQHNPLSDERVVDFGLYGLHRAAVADGEANFYGASKAEVARRLTAIGPIFTGRLSAADVKARAVAQGIDVLVVSAADPVWSDHGDWLWSVPALFALPHVRLIATSDLGPER